LDIKKDILWRVYISFIAIILLCFVVLGKAFYVQQFQGNIWRHIYDSLNVHNQEVLAERGTIYSEDGKMLSTSIPEFDVFIDFRVEALRANKNKLFNTYVDSLAIGLSNLFEDYPAPIYAKILRKEFKKKTPYYLLQKQISYQKYKLLKELPLVRLGRTKSGFIIETKNKRYNPFDQLAFRTIGLARDSFKVGLELSYDSILKGKSGSRTVRSIAGGAVVPIENGLETETENGKDVYTTLDVYIQEVTHQALLNKMYQNNAQSGCAIVMETKTGKIKAISNLGFDEATNSYIENKNYSLYATEPGSTIKLASLLALKEDGKINANTIVNIGDGPWKFSDKVVVKDADGHSKSILTAQEVFEASSNIGIAKLVWANYGKQPQNFVSKYSTFRLDSLTGIDLVGERKPNVHKPNTKNWNYTDLMWMSFGYSIAINPLQTLTLYNAVANDGVMVKPYLVNAIKNEGVTIKEFSPTVLNAKICSDSTLSFAKRCMLGVCHGSMGTARNLFAKNAYLVAGKTGTSFVAEPGIGYANEIYQSSFVGYFPANNPQYTCIVVIVNKKNSPEHLGAKVAGPVFKEIADKLYTTYVKAKTNAPNGLVQQSNNNISYSMHIDDADVLARRFGINTTTIAKPDEDWASLKLLSQKNIVQSKKISTRLMPDLIGFSAKDAVFVCEQMGLNVSLNGLGKIVQQSIVPNSKIINGEKIVLTLK
jgi:cell division protein FtsI (penicillin-binding protein 3)